MARWPPLIHETPYALDEESPAASRPQNAARGALRQQRAAQISNIERDVE
jgi:hypothetical protein